MWYLFLFFFASRFFITVALFVMTGGLWLTDVVSWTLERFDATVLVARNVNYLFVSNFVLAAFACKSKVRKLLQAKYGGPAAPIKPIRRRRKNDGPDPSAPIDVGGSIEMTGCSKEADRPSPADFTNPAFEEIDINS